MSEHYKNTLRSVAKVLLAFLAGLVICAMLPSCKRVEYVSVPEYHTDTLRTIQLQRDSIYMRDSIYVTKEMRGDTLYMTIGKVQTQYRDRVRIDTAYISKTDSVTVVKEVEKIPGTWDRIKNGTWPICLAALAFLIAVISANLFDYFRRK